MSKKKKVFEESKGIKVEIGNIEALKVKMLSDINQQLIRIANALEEK